VWNNVLTRFFDRYPISPDIVINDFGATPGVVYLR
ncbi:malonate decarboxylase acyl carrier protein, partial [Enterococcus faecium]